MPFLADSIETALIRTSYRLQYGIRLPGFGLDGMSTAFSNEWRENSHWVWEQALIFIGAAALVGFFLGRRKLPGWLLTVFVILAWLGAYEAGPLLAARWLESVIAHLNGHPIGVTAGLLIWAIVGYLPRSILFSVPAIRAIRDIRRDRQSSPSWLEWTGLGLVVVLFLIAEPTELIRSYSTTPNKMSWGVETFVRLVTMLIALFLSLILCGMVRVSGRRIEGDRGPN